MVIQPASLDNSEAIEAGHTGLSEESSQYVTNDTTNCM
jgi:hypothetical protein